MFPKRAVDVNAHLRATAFDGRSLWLAPHSQGDRAVRWVDTAKAVFLQDGYSSSGLIFTNDTLDRGELNFTLFTKNLSSSPSESTGIFDGHLCAVFDGNQTIFIIPYTADYVVAFNTITGITTELRDWPSDVDLNSPGTPFVGAVFDGNRYIWLSPYDAKHVARIDVTDGGTIDKAPFAWPAGVTSIGEHAFSGAACDTEFVWFAPRKSNSVVRINIHTNEVIHITSWNQVGAGFVKSGGFTGIVFDGVNQMWLCPGQANQFVRVSTDRTVKMTGFKDFPVEFQVNWGVEYAFIGCTYDRRRRTLWAPPADGSSHLIRLDSDTGSMKAIPLFFDSGKSLPKQFYARAVFTGGDALMLVPRNGNHNGTALVRYNVETGTTDHMRLDGVPGIDDKTVWGALLYDGHSIWQTPLTSKYIIRWTADGTGPLPPTSPPSDQPSHKSNTTTKSVSTAASASVTPPTPPPQTSDAPLETNVTDTPATSTTPAVTDATNDTTSSYVETETPSPPPPTTPVPTGTIDEETEEPRVPGRVVKVSTILPGGEEANTAVMTTAGGSAVATSTFAGTATVSSVARVSAATRMLDCPLTEDDPRPSYFELPLQFSLGGKTGYFAGAALIAAVLTAVLAAVATYLEWTQSGSPKVLRALGAFSAAHLMYFGPNALGACVTVLFHAEEAAPRVAAVAAIGLVFVVACYYIPCLVFKRAPQRVATKKSSADEDSDGLAMKLDFVAKCTASSTSSNSDDRSSDDDRSSSSSSDDDDNSSSTDTSTATTAGAPAVNAKEKAQQEWFLYHVEPWFDATRDFKQPATRMYSAVEFVSAAVAQMLAGVRPSDGCVNVAWGILVVSIAMLGYLIVIRPYRTRLDMIFSLAVNATQLGLTVCVLYVVKAGVMDPDHPTMKVVEGSLFLLVGIYYVQVLAQGYWTWHCTQRRRAALEASETKHAALLVMVSPPDNSNDTLQDPLLSSSDDEEEMGDVAVSNPLHQDE